MRGRKAGLVLLAVLLSIVSSVVIVNLGKLDFRPQAVAHNVRVFKLGWIASVSLWLFCLTFDTIRLRQLDWLSPRALLGMAHLVTSFGKQVVDRVGLLDASGVLNNATTNAYSVLVALSVTGLMLGTYLGEFWAKRKQADVTRPSSRFGELTKWQAQRLRRISEPVMMLCVVILAANAIWYANRFIVAGVAYGADQFQTGLSYYVSVGLSLLLPPSIIVTMYSAGMHENKKIPFSVWTVLVVSLVLNGVRGTRGFSMIILFSFLLCVHFHFKRIRLAVLAPLALCLSVYLLAVVYWRASGWSASAVKNSLQASDLVLRSVLTLVDSLASPEHITTHTMAWFPTRQKFLLGRSYLDAVFSLIPGFLFGGSLNRPFLSPSLLFKELYETRFLANQGYGFAMTAEAYMNFGSFGPPLIFFLSGLWLQNLYQRAKLSVVSPVQLWMMIVYASYPFNLRSDAIALVKQIVYGAAFLAIALWWVKGMPVPNGRSESALAYSTPQKDG